jgi:FMN phosphatase YigB (HAD superfamily)
MYLFNNFKYKIYCDMDGVLVDFEKGYFELTGIDIAGQWHTTSEFWDPINNQGEKFWVDLEWKEDGKKLWQYIEEYYPVLLSSPSRNGYGSRKGKNTWVNRELPGVPLLLEYSNNKKKYAEPNSILIDDRDSNIEQWVSSGGIGILHTSTEETIEELRKLGL